jgi:hypothetical protein
METAAGGFETRPYAERTTLLRFQIVVAGPPRSGVTR